MSKSAISNSLTKPPRTPSPRDLDVYKRAKIWRLPQWEVAYDLKVHYSSVSKIVKRVHSWLALGGDPIDPEIRDFAVRQQLAETTTRLRLTRAIELATTAMEINPDPEPIVRRRLVNGVEVWREETEKPVPSLNLNALRAVVSATSALRRLDNQIAQLAPERIPQQSSPEKLLAAIIDLLTNWRLQAESQGHVPTTTDAQITVVTTLRALLGNSVPGSSLGPQEPEAPASSNASTTSHAPSTLNLKLGTLNSRPSAAVQEIANLTNLTDVNATPLVPTPIEPTPSSSRPSTAFK